MIRCVGRGAIERMISIPFPFGYSDRISRGLTAHNCFQMQEPSLKFFNANPLTRELLGRIAIYDRIGFNLN